MKVGIKYCGGCNPRFDRISAMEKFKDKNSDITFESLDIHKKYDKVMLICGCERTCLRFRPEFEAYERIIVGDEEDFNDIEF